MTAPSPMHAFFFTDVAGSTTLWERFPAEMQRAYDRHDAILREAAEKHAGVVFKVIGDAFQIAFPTPEGAVAAAIAAQSALSTERWPLPVPLLVRMALHAGEIAPDRSGDFRSPILNRLGRLLSCGHGGQILLSNTMADAVRDAMPADCSLRSLGARQLRGFPAPEPIWQVEGPGLLADFAPIVTEDVRRFDLPAPPTSIIGRDDDLDRLVALFDQGARLITLTGPGGAGKTRLSLAAGERLRDRWGDGVVFIELAAISDPALVPAAIADALDLRSDGIQSSFDTLSAWLANREILLILDNLEQVIDAASDIAKLLANAPGVRMIATSREALHIRAEQQFPVDLLAVPEPQQQIDVATIGAFPSVRLFVERASAVVPRFALTEDNADDVAEICRQVEGLPLAIELAAARIGSLSTVELRKRLSDRLQILTGGARDLPDRQQTLRNTIAWSYELLSDAERDQFRALALFSGGFELDAASAVFNVWNPANTAEALDLLVSKHLLNRFERHGRTRYMMLESVREFARETLRAAGDEDDVARQHAGWFHGWIVGHPNSRDPSGLDEIEIDHANLRSALDWADAHAEAEMHLELAVALARFWQFRGHVREGRTKLERALARTPNVRSEARQAALAEAGTLANANGNYATARQHFEAALELAEYRHDQAAIAAILNSIGGVLLALGDSVSAEGMFTQSLDMAERIGDVKRAMTAQSNLGAVAHYRGELETARSLYEAALVNAREIGDTFNIALITGNLLILLAAFPDARDEAIAFGEESLRHYDQLGDHQGKGYAYDGLGTIAEVARDAETARRYYEQSLAQFRAAEDPGGIAMATMGLGSCASLNGNRHAAAALYHEALASFVDLDERDSVGNVINALAEIAVAERDFATAARLMGFTERVHRELDVSVPPQTVTRLATARAAASEALGSATFDAIREEGAQLSDAQAVEIATQILSRVDTSTLA